MSKTNLKAFTAQEIFDDILPIGVDYDADDTYDEEHGNGFNLEEWGDKMHADFKNWLNENSDKKFNIATTDASYWGLDESDVIEMTDDEYSDLSDELEGMGPTDLFAYSIEGNTIKLVDMPNGVVNGDSFALIITEA